MTRLCKNPDCGKPIRWRSFIGRNGVQAGYYVNETDSSRHLCPGWIDPRVEEERDAAVQIKSISIEDKLTTIERHLSHHSTTLQEILLKLDAVLN